ncbi:MAG: PTS glucitol/sorbitol transporter subunit IIC, partial [Gilliamella apicola]|nr:PTS glucitol/sorbitol transporter subunit IIC [Gilliamella apicola]
MEYIEWFGTHFIGLFQAGGKVFVGFMTDIVPLLIVLLTFTYSLIAFISEQRVTKAIQFSAKNMLLRYSLMPILSVLMLTNP